MVSKITLFEPHIEGAQFGPASLHGPDADATDPAETTIGSGTETAGPSKSRLSRARKALLVVPVVAVILGGAVAWRRFRTVRETDESRGEGTETNTAAAGTIEERTAAAVPE
jgi:hypothetical protein